MKRLRRRVEALALLWAAAGVASGLAGCASTPVDPSPSVVSVHLPVEHAGIRDERLRFARVFERELPQGTAAEEWLHLPEGVQDKSVMELEPLDRLFEQRRRGTAVLIVPGLFGDCVDDQSVPFGDGRVRPREAEAFESYASYQSLGLQAVFKVDLPGRYTSERNGEILTDAILDAAGRPEVERIVLVSYSKGTADALHALTVLERNGRLPSKVSTLVSVAGVVMGTPLADRFETLYGAVSPHVTPLGCSPAQGQELASLTVRERALWLANARLPRSVQYHSIVAWPSRSEQIAPLLRPFHQWLSKLDRRNDGQVLTRDSILPGGTLIAEADADHWDVALPRDRHPNGVVRALGSGRPYPREALFSALIKWAVGTAP